MAEPRARPRQKGQVFHDNDLRELLFSYGDSPAGSLPNTVSLLDEILTDFILETCHAAALCASYSRRQKIKADDFRWVVRKNSAMLGRIGEVLFREKWLKEQRKGIDVSEGLGRGNVEDLGGIAEVGGAGEEARKKGKGRGRGRRKRKAEDGSEAGDAKSAKKLKASP